MAGIPLYNLGTLGIIKDTKPHLLPPEAWSDGINVRFNDGKALKTLGYSSIWGTETIVPYYALNVSFPNSWLYLGLNKAFVYTGGTHTDITRVSGDYSATTQIPWTGGLLGGIPIVNNGIDIPQVWNPHTTATKLVDLPAWPSTIRARVVKPFKNFIVAINLTESGTQYEHQILWSTSADPGALPSTFDIADPTEDAGRTEITDISPSGQLLDQLPLGDINLLYKEGSTHLMQLSGDSYIFRIRQLFESVGVLATGCVASFTQGRKHFVVTANDVVVHDGQNVDPVLDKKLVKWLFSSIDSTYYYRTFVAVNYENREVWICFPENGHSVPNMALVWNWVDNVPSIRTLGIYDANFIATGIVDDATSDQWNSDSAQWNDDISVWNTQSQYRRRMVLLSNRSSAERVFALDQTNQYNNTDMLSYVERTGLSVVGKDRLGNPKSDIESTKFISRIWPKVTGGPINVRVGSQQALDGPITWTADQVFDPNTQKYLDMMDGNIPGKLLAVRFTGIDDSSWELTGYDVEVVVGSEL